MPISWKLTINFIIFLFIVVMMLSTEAGKVLREHNEPQRHFLSDM